MPWPAADPAPDPALTQSFAGCVPHGRLAGPLYAYARVGSTQDVARAWADTGAPEGTVVVADYQTAGHGQHRRPWTAPAGTGLLFSVLLRPALPVSRWPELPLAAGCAVAEALEAVAPVGVQLKWPNDVLVAGRKVAGILADGVTGARPAVVVGIGVNVSQRDTEWPRELASLAASLATFGIVVARETLLTAILARLDAWYGVLLDDGFMPVREAWRRRGLLGTPVPLGEGAGTAVDLGPAGELVVRRDDGRVSLVVALPVRERDRVEATPS